MLAEWFQIFVDALNHPVTRAFAIPISISSLLVSLWVARRTHNAINEAEASRHYLHLDNAYADILKIAIAHPHLRTPGAQKTPLEEEQYSCYAQIVWNFLETIYDKFKADRETLITWGTALIREANLHDAWIKKHENAVQYKPEFRTFIEAFRQHKEPPR